MKNWKVYAVVILVAAGVYFIAFHTDRFLADFWPLDASRVAPNLIASVVQWALIGFFLYLLYPPFRRAVERFAARHVESIKAHVEHLHAETRAHSEELHRVMHARLDTMFGNDEVDAGETGGEVLEPDPPA